MSLALHLGMTEEVLLRSMTEAELFRWMQFASKHQLPLRRIELMIAQQSVIIAKFAGAKNAQVADFLLTPPDERASVEAELRVKLGFKPRKKK